MRKKLLCAVMALVLLLPVLTFGTVAEPTDADDVFAANNSAVAYCIDTEQVLYENNADIEHAPGVTTKLMALMVAYDLVENTGRKLTEKVKVQGDWVRDSYVPGDRSSPYLGLTQGDECTLEYLFACSLVANANDACAALVGYCVDELMMTTTEEFVQRMNQKASELEMRDTLYVDAIGFGGKGKTTAGDVVKLAKAFYLYDELVKLSDRDAYDGPRSTIRNKNYLECDYLMKGYLMEEAMGLIAGHSTNQGGYHLITFAEIEYEVVSSQKKPMQETGKDDGEEDKETVVMPFVFVVMGGSRERQEADGSRWFDPGNAYDDMHGMVPYVLNSNTYYRLCIGKEDPKNVTFLADLRLGGGAEEGILHLLPAETLELMAPNPGGAEVKTVLEYDERVYETEKGGKTYMTVDAPVTQGEVLGKAIFILNGVEIGSVDMVAQESVDVNPLLSAKNQLFSFLFEGSMGVILKWVLIIILGWVALAVLLWLIRMVIRLVRWQSRKNAEKNPKESKKLKEAPEKENMNKM